MKFIPVPVFFAIIFAVGCSSDESPAPSASEEELFIQAYLDSMGIAWDTTGGFYHYRLEGDGTGKTQAEGNVLSIYYTLTVLGGDTIIKYDSARGEPLVVKQGVNAIYPVAFDQALSFLKEGEEWGFVFPARHAYGELSFSGLIPENATLEAKIELVEIRKEDEVLMEELNTIQEFVTDAEWYDTVRYPQNRPRLLPSGLGVYKRVRTGNGPRPVVGDTVTVTYEVQNLAGDQIAVRGAAGAFVFEVDGGEVMAGLNLAVKQMQPGERAWVVLPSTMGYTYSVAVIPGFQTIRERLVEENIIPAYAARVMPYEILLVDLELINVN